MNTGAAAVPGPAARALIAEDEPLLAAGLAAELAALGSIGSFSGRWSTTLLNRMPTNWRQ